MDLSKPVAAYSSIDEAYQLASGNNFGGRNVLDFILAEIEERRGTIAFIPAGYTNEMEKFFEHNPGLDSRMPQRLHFADYSDDELLTMLDATIERKYHGKTRRWRRRHLCEDYRQAPGSKPRKRRLR